MTHTSRRRGGFTLIEVLVVIAIIAILVALTTAGVFRYMDKIPEITTKNEISQLSNALAAFKTKFRMYPPSRIFLANSLFEYEKAPDPHPSGLTLAERTAHLALLRRIWPRLAPPAVNTPGFDWTGGAAPANWRGVVLEGHECLVFFLSGIPDQSTPGGVGFSTDGTNPTRTRPANTPGGEVKFFTEWQTSRLVKGNNDFYVYLDPYFSHGDRAGAKPYAFFSNPWTRENQYGVGDCAGIGAAPYLSAASRFHNPSSFQIISAGKNRAFGPGGVWLPVNAMLIGPAGADDISNFYDSFLGVAP